MRRQRTFRVITRVLGDGSWHTLDELRDVTRWPDLWVAELKLEGLVDTDEKGGSLLVRLRRAARLTTSRA